MNPYDFCFTGAKVTKLLHTTSILSKKCCLRATLYIRKDYMCTLKQIYVASAFGVPSAMIDVIIPYVMLG